MIKSIGFVFAAMIALLSATAAFAQSYGFTDQTVAAGMTGNGVCFGWQHGVSVGDLNRDGFQDIIRCGPPMEILINNGDGTFTNIFANSGIRRDYGPEHPLLQWANSASVADYDRDGDLDIHFSSFADLNPNNFNTVYRDRLFRNNGDLTFTDVSLDDGPTFQFATSWSTTWGDYDLDGDLDLARASYTNCASDSNGLFRNNGDGTFKNVTATSGLGLDCFSRRTKGFTVRFVDMNDDRYPELIWIGDLHTSYYFVNNTDSTFTNYTTESGFNFGINEMGLTVGDYNLAGMLDIYTTFIGRGLMYLNQSNHVYAVAPFETSEHPAIYGWGAVSIDFNHDGRLDIVTTGMNSGSPTLAVGQTALLNQSTTEAVYFADVTPGLGIDGNESGRGLANFDYDNDGDQDILVAACDEPLKLCRSEVSGPDTHWLRIFLDNNGVSDIPPDGIGSVIRVRTGDVRQRGRIDGGNNYLSQSEMSAHFGLGAATVIDELRVEWTNGAVTTMTNVAADQRLTIFAPSASLTGDMNCDATIDGRDVDGFVLAVLDQAAYESRYPLCEFLNGDIDGNEQVDSDDMAEFVALILAQ